MQKSFDMNNTFYISLWLQNNLHEFKPLKFTNSKADFVLKNWFERIVLKISGFKNKTDPDLVFKVKHSVHTHTKC